MSSYITVEEVRHYILDRSPDDNEIDFDLAFTDEEIGNAMKYAARDYASIPPMIGGAPDPNRLPGDYMLFLDGIIHHLYRMKVSQLSRNDIDYSAGGVGANIVAKRIERLSLLSDRHEERFRQQATDIKKTKNLRRAFGRVG